MSSAARRPRPAGLEPWDMPESYLPIYQLALDLGALRANARFWNDQPSREVFDSDARIFPVLLEEIHRKCLAFGFTHTAELAKRIIQRNPSLKTYSDILSPLNHLNDSLNHELEAEAVFRIPDRRKEYFERDDLFGPEVATAFASCARDIRKAGSCYALAQEDACVHHLMLVLERGLNALAAKVNVPYLHTNWQNIIGPIGSKLKSEPRGPEREFLLVVNAQFGFLKDAYRNHSEHARDDPYDMEKALSILNHVRAFMRALAKGGLTE
jgi:hypothetical protein